MRDIWIMCKKELRELLVAYGDRRGWLLRMAIFIGAFGLFMGIGFGLPALVKALPEGIRQDLLRWLVATDPAVVGVGLLLALVVADVALLTLAIRRFRRARLVLE